MNNYANAKAAYAAIGVDTDAAIATLKRVPIALHCWQGDDVRGFDQKVDALSGGIQTTGNYPGRARTPEELMADIDMGGADWAPIGQFYGSLDGNGYAIKNFTVTKSTIAGNNAEDVDANNQNMGFFSTIEKSGEVKNLKLEQVRVIATENAVFIGLLTGSNRGKIIDCTTQGYVTDSRTSLTGNVYVGTIAGRNNNGTGTITVTSAMEYLEATAGSSNPADKVTGVTSKMGMDFAELSAESTGKRKIGIAGNSKAEQIDTSLIWQDSSSDSSLLSETEQERRQAAVDEMYKMGTVAWTPSETIYYTVEGKKTYIHSNAYIAGRTYYGIPYNGVGGGYERAMSIMQAEKDDQGRYVTVTGLEDGTKDADGKYTGFTLMMGNDCSSAIGWAWGVVAPSRMVDEGTRVETTPNMVPNQHNIDRYGMYPAGDYQMLTSNTEKYSSYVDARDTQTIIEINGGAQGMAEYYAKTHKGDALLCVEYDLDTETDKWVKGTGHARLVAADPVIIRNYKGQIDLKTSYVITHEQGDGLFDNKNANGKYDTYNGYNVKYTSWRINHKYSLYVLLTEKGFKADANPGCGWGYVPVTISAFSYEGDLRTPYYHNGYTSESNYHPVELPNSGWYYSNFMVASATLTITDGNGQVVYTKTGYPAGRTTVTENLKLDELFPEATDGLTAGATYYCTLTAVASDNNTYTIAKDHAFVAK